MEKWHTSQVALLSTEIESYNWCILDNLWLDKCPNLKCQIALEGIKEIATFEQTELHEFKETFEWKLELWLVGEETEDSWEHEAIFNL